MPEYCENCGQETDTTVSMIVPGYKATPKVCLTCFQSGKVNDTLKIMLEEGLHMAKTNDDKRLATHGVTESSITFHAVLGQFSCPAGKPVKIVLEIPVTQSIHFDTLRRLQSEKLKITLQAEQVDAFLDKRSGGEKTNKGTRGAGKPGFPQTTMPGTSSGKDAAAGA